MTYDKSTQLLIKSVTTLMKVQAGMPYPIHKTVGDLRLELVMAENFILYHADEIQKCMLEAASLTSMAQNYDYLKTWEGVKIRAIKNMLRGSRE